MGQGVGSRSAMTSPVGHGENGIVYVQGLYKWHTKYSPYTGATTEDTTGLKWVGRIGVSRGQSTWTRISYGVATNGSGATAGRAEKSIGDKGDYRSWRGRPASDGGGGC